MDAFDPPEGKVLVLSREHELLAILNKQSPSADGYDPERPWLLLARDGKTLSLPTWKEGIKTASAIFPTAVLAQSPLEEPITRLIVQDEPADSSAASAVFVGEYLWKSGALPDTEEVPEFATGFRTAYAPARKDVPIWFTWRDFLRKAPQFGNFVNPLLQTYRVDGVGEDTLHTTSIVLSWNAVSAVTDSGLTNERGSYLATPIACASLYVIAKMDESLGKLQFCTSRNPANVKELNPLGPGGLFLGNLVQAPAVFRMPLMLSKNYKKAGFFFMPVLDAIRQVERERMGHAEYQGSSASARPRRLAPR